MVCFRKYARRAIPTRMHIEKKGESPMAIQEVLHPRWGSNLADQTSARAWKGMGNCGDYNITTEEYKGFFGRMKTRKKKEYVGIGWVSVSDDNEDAIRQYRHRCGLIKVIMTPHRNGPMFVALLDGHVTSNFASNEIEFRFAPDGLAENDGKPIAEVWFQGEGERRGPLHNYGTSRIVCTFADEAQMDHYLDVTGRKVPKSVTHNGATYHATGTGDYRSDDGSVLPYLLLAYLLLSPSEQKAFAAENSEVRDMLGNASEVVQGDVAGESETNERSADASADLGGSDDASGSNSDDQGDSDTGDAGDDSGGSDISSGDSDSGGGGGDFGGGGGGD